MIYQKSHRNNYIYDSQKILCFSKTHCLYFKYLNYKLTVDYLIIDRSINFMNMRSFIFLAIYINLTCFQIDTICNYLSKSIYYTFVLFTYTLKEKTFNNVYFIPKFLYICTNILLVKYFISDTLLLIKLYICNIFTSW